MDWSGGRVQFALRLTIPPTVDVRVRPPRLNVEIKRAIARLNKQWAVVPDRRPSRPPAVQRPYFKLPEPLSGARPDASPCCPLNCGSISGCLSGRNPLFDSDVLPLPPLPSFRLICIRTSHTETSSAPLEGRDITKNERKDGRARERESTLPIEPKFDKRKNGYSSEGGAFCRHKAISPRTISPSPSSSVLPLPLHFLSCIDSDVSREPRAPKSHTKTYLPCVRAGFRTSPGEQ